MHVLVNKCNYRKCNVVLIKIAALNCVACPLRAGMRSGVRMAVASLFYADSNKL